jgi:hypothetical protein
MKKFFLSLLTLSLVHSATAFATDYKFEVDHRLGDLLHIPANLASATGSKACLNRYQSLYQDGVLNVTVGFGYWDNSPGEFVFDQFISNGLRVALMAPCSPGVNVCGFKRSGDLFTKTVRGPDGKPNRFTINLLSSSLSSDNVANTTVNRVKQYAHCEAVTRNYFNEIARGSEVVMYVGHARNGGGPDFCPPVRDGRKHTNYPWYEANRPGFNRLLTSLATAESIGKPNQIVGLYSCYSRRHFHKEMARTSPKTGFVLTDVEISSIDALNSLVTTLDAVIAQKCGTGLMEGLRLSQGVNIYGMFPNH